MWTGLAPCGTYANARPARDRGPAAAVGGRVPGVDPGAGRRRRAGARTSDIPSRGRSGATGSRSAGSGSCRSPSPASFNWPGPWLAVLRAADGEGCVGAVAFGAPPGMAWNPLGGAEAFDAVQRGYLVAPADVALWTPPAAAAPRSAGRVEAIAGRSGRRGADGPGRAARWPGRPRAGGRPLLRPARDVLRRPRPWPRPHADRGARCSTTSSCRTAGSRPRRRAGTSSPAAST